MRRNFGNPRFKGHSHRDIGPLRVNYSTRGMTSWGIRVDKIPGLGWLKVSWNSRTRKWRWNSPGFGYVEFDGPAPPMADKVNEYAEKLPRRRPRRRW